MNVTCEVCGKSVSVPPSRAKKFRTCSRTCMGELFAREKSNSVQIYCQICGKPFYVKPSHLYRRRTCSRKCGAKMKEITMRGSMNHQFGLRGTMNSSFAGITTYKNGYAYVYRPTHPYASASGRIREHRAVVEEQLTVDSKYLDDRGYLLPSVHVHHKNGNTLDNRPENLEPLTQSEHVSLHNKLCSIRRGKDGRIIGVSKPGELLEACEGNQQRSY